MNQAECREKLSRLMSEESRALNELSTLLDREHGYLQANDVGSLESATLERQQCVARIFRVDEDRRTLCSAMDRTVDLPGLEDLIRWCDPQGSLASGWADCSAAAVRCRQLNDRNGALVAARLKHVQARLGALIDGRRQGGAVTYGPRGAYGPSSSGRVVATEA
jgi:flagellar biosynthesis/type III secretory pathway chaperone